MAHHHAGHRHPVADVPGWSLLRLSAGQRLAIAAVIVACLWVATFAVMS